MHTEGLSGAMGYQGSGLVFYFSLSFSIHDRRWTGHNSILIKHSHHFVEVLAVCKSQLGASKRHTVLTSSSHAKVIDTGAS